MVSSMVPGSIHWCNVWEGDAKYIGPVTGPKGDTGYVSSETAAWLGVRSVALEPRTTAASTRYVVLPSGLLAPQYLERCPAG